MMQLKNSQLWWTIMLSIGNINEKKEDSKRPEREHVNTQLWSFLGQKYHFFENNTLRKYI